MTRPRVGFVGTGWIGRSRMEAICRTGLVVPAAIYEPDPEARREAHALSPQAKLAETFEDVLAERLDGIVIATPSALHAEQAIRALERGAAVFCQKPLGRNAVEVKAVVSAARTADRLLGADFSYRDTAAVQAIAPLVRSGELGRIYAADLVFHNAYGPDKPWFYDRALSGGGCVLDLGVHLVDLLLWLLDFPEVRTVDAHLYAAGRRLPPVASEVEDFANVEIGMADDVTARLACSWHLHAGRDAVISATLYGTKGSVNVRNVAGSFYDFEAFLFTGTSASVLAAPPDDWGGRTAAHWARRLAAAPRFDGSAEHYVTVAQIIDAIYAGRMERAAP